MLVEQSRWKKWKRLFRWLRGTPERARCSLCSTFECVVYQKGQLQQHERSLQHRSSGNLSAPPVSDFDQLIEERRKGTSFRKSKLGAHKAIKILWCLNEGVKELVKQRIRHGLITASISQDGQGAAVGARLCVVTKSRAFFFYLLCHFFNSILCNKSSLN